MRYSLIIFIILVLNFSFAFSLYDINEGVVSFSVQKQINLSGEGSIIELEYLSIRDDFSDQKIMGIDEYLIVDGNRYDGEYVYDDYLNRYITFKIEKEGIKRISFHGDYNIYVSKDYGFNDFNIIDSNTNISKTKYINPDLEKLDNLIDNDPRLYKTLTNLTSWILNNIEYNLRPDFINGNVYSSDMVLDKKSGSCTEYSNLAVAYLRSRDIDSQIVVGYANTGNGLGLHAWVRLDQNGLIEYDPTYHQIQVDPYHIKQAIFEDYSLAKDHIRTDYDDVNPQWITSPFSIPYIVSDSKESKEVSFSIKNPVFSEKDFNICFDFNKTRAGELLVGMHPDFNFNYTKMDESKKVLKEILYVDNNYCVPITSPYVDGKAKYSYYVSFVDLYQKDILEVKRETQKIAAEQIKSEIDKGITYKHILIMVSFIIFAFILFKIVRKLTSL